MKGIKLLLFSPIVFFLLPAHGQDSLGNTPLTIPAAFQLALQHSVQLQISHSYTDLAKQQTQIEKLGRLPTVTTSLDYGYLSNADVWTPNLKQHEVAGLPHPLTLFSVEASETIFSGNRINNSIRRSALQEQIAFLSLEKNATDIKYLVAAGYLDIFRLLNQRRVYINNTLLAKQRLKNILVLRKQGMVTQNDELRTELSISDYELMTRKIGNNIAQLNNQLNIVLGLPDTARLIPDTSLLQEGLTVGTLDQLLDETYRESHELKLSGKEKEVSETNIRLLKGERLPELGLFGASNLQRPFLNAIPAIDIYYNIYRVGVGLHYNIASIYQSPRKIKAGYIDLEISRQKDSLTRQNVEVGVRNTFIQYNESLDELRTFRQDLRSAEENYRIVENRYFNHLALLTDLIDATNTKIEAEIRVTNAEINKIYNYYQLLKTIGTL
jgi:outer membrane protein TolC